MVYLGIDQHKRQVTVNLRAEDGTVILKRQVSTRGERVRTFFADLAEKARPEGGFLAILEVCGMNPWLLEILKEHGCREIVVIQPTERSQQKTDRRDAGELAHLLWVHRQQFLEGKRPLGQRTPPPQDAAGRVEQAPLQLTHASTRHQSGRSIPPTQPVFPPPQVLPATPTPAPQLSISIALYDGNPCPIHPDSPGSVARPASHRCSRPIVLRNLMPNEKCAMRAVVGS